MKKKTFSKLFLVSFISAICMAGCKEDEDVLVKSITFEKAEMTLTAGEYEDIITSVTPDNAVNKTLVWQSSNIAIVGVDNNGRITAVEEGTAVITATSVNMVTATCRVTVTNRVIPVSSVSFDQTSISIYVGDKETLKANVMPENATNKTIKWISSDDEIASVDDMGEITALKEGSTIITATTEDGGNTASCTLTVTNKAILVTDVSINEFSIVLAIGVKETLIATVGPDDATNKKVIWNSNKTEVATVNEEGEVVAIKKGIATITATTEGGDKTATCTVMVITGGLTGNPDNEIIVEIPKARLRIISGVTKSLRDPDVWWRAYAKDVIVNYPNLQGTNTFFGYTDSDDRVLLCEVINFPDFDFLRQWDGEFVHTTSLGTVIEVNIQLKGVVRLYTDENGEKYGTMELLSFKRTGPDTEEHVLQLGTYTETYPNPGYSKIEFIDHETIRITEAGYSYTRNYEIRERSIVLTHTSSESEIFFRIINNSTFEIEFLFGLIGTVTFPIMSYERDNNK